MHSNILLRTLCAWRGAWYPQGGPGTRHAYGREPGTRKGCHYMSRLLQALVGSRLYHEPGTRKGYHYMSRLLQALMGSRLYHEPGTRKGYHYMSRPRVRI